MIWKREREKAWAKESDSEEDRDPDYKYLKKVMQDVPFEKYQTIKKRDKKYENIF